MIDQGARYAVFDLDGTLLRSNIVWPYMHARRRLMNPYLYWFWCLGFLLYAGIYYRWLDARGRSLFQKRFYRRYERLPYEAVCRWSARYVQTALKHRRIAPALELLGYLKSRGVAVSILSTGIAPVVEPIAAVLGVGCTCIGLNDADGLCKVALDSLEGFKERFIQTLDPARTIAVADDIHDLPVLRYVRYPVVVGRRYRPWMQQLSDGLLVRWKRKGQRASILPIDGGG